MSLSFSKFQLSGQVSDRHLCEMFSHQFMYGAREVLLEYMKLSFDSVFCGVLQHGVAAPSELWNNFPSPILNLRRSPIWVASEEGKMYLKEKGVKRVYAIGSAWTYFLDVHELQVRNRRSIEVVPKRKQILFFADHSLWNSRFQYRDSNINATLGLLRKNFPRDEITICVYFTDYLSGNWHKLAHKFNMEVVCAGSGVTSPTWSVNPARILFFDKLKTFYDQHEVAVFESYTSAIFYAISLGLPVMIMRNKEEPTFPYSSQITNEFLKAFPKIENKFCLNDSLREYTHEILGTDSKLDRETLKSVLRPRKVQFLTKDYAGFQRS